MGGCRCLLGQRVVNSSILLLCLLRAACSSLGLAGLYLFCTDSWLAEDVTVPAFLLGMPKINVAPAPRTLPANRSWVRCQPAPTDVPAASYRNLSASSFRPSLPSQISSGRHRLCPPFLAIPPMLIQPRGVRLGKAERWGTARGSFNSVQDAQRYCARY